MLSLLGWLCFHRPTFTTRLARRRRFPSRSIQRRCVRPSLEELEARLVLSTITDLGIGTPFAINNSGEVVGQFQNSSNQAVAFLSNNGAKPIPIGGSGSSAEGINDAGIVVGEDGSGNGFVYNSANKQTTSLGLVNIYDLGAGTMGGPQLGIGPSASGSNVVGNGEGTLSDQAFQAAPPYSTTQGLPPPSGYFASGAVGINGNGQVAGYLQMTANGAKHAAIYSGGQWQDIGKQLSDPYSVANAINASGEVVGYSLTASNGITGTDHAFLYNPNNTTSPLTVLKDLIDPTTGQPYQNIEANGINNQGWVVGSAGNGNNTVGVVAVLWKGGNSTPIDLNTLLPPNSGAHLTDAFAINDNNQIIGVDGVTGHMYLLNLNGGGNTGGGGGSGGGGGGGGGGHPTELQALESLFIDGVEFAIDYLTLQNSSAVQANIAANLPYAGPYGQMFEYLGIEAVINAIQQANQPPAGDSDGDNDGDSDAASQGFSQS